MKTRSTYWPIVCLLFLGGTAFGQRIEVRLMDRNAIEERLLSVATNNRERKARLQELFIQAGCPAEHLREQPVGGLSMPNVICTLPGSAESMIVVGGHYDANYDFGRGIVDNWSGASLLPSLYQTIKNVPRRHTYVFVGFAGEEQGLIGSRHYVSRLSKDQKEQIAAMINLDCLGLTSTKVEFQERGRGLAELLYAVSRVMKLPLSGVDVSRVGLSDADSFSDAKIPAITIHTITQETLPVLHSGKDRKEVIQWEDYFNTYKLTGVYLAALDTYAVGSGKRKKSD